MAQSRSYGSTLDSSDYRCYDYSFEGGRRQNGGEISEKENKRANPEGSSLAYTVLS